MKLFEVGEREASQPLEMGEKISDTADKLRRIRWTVESSQKRHKNMKFPRISKKAENDP